VLDARHILIPPYTPRWNGKIERFFGTLDREWAHGASGPTAPPATAPCKATSASTTADDHTQPPAADHHHPRSPTPRAEQLALEAEGQLGLREAVTARYDALKQLLDDRLGLRPEPETTGLYRRLLAQVEDDPRR
jgi:transposase InsO family protein